MACIEYWTRIRVNRMERRKQRQFRSFYWNFLKEKYEETETDTTFRMGKMKWELNEEVGKCLKQVASTLRFIDASVGNLSNKKKYMVRQIRKHQLYNLLYAFYRLPGKEQTESEEELLHTVYKIQQELDDIKHEARLSRQQSFRQSIHAIENRTYTKK